MEPVIQLDIDQCAHCGLVVADDAALEFCAACSFEYCRQHCDPTRHECWAICTERGEVGDGFAEV
jgi:hypothetical protein